MTFGGTNYAVVNGEGFDLRKENMVMLGVATETTLPNHDGSVWGIPDIDPTIVAAAFDGDDLELLVEASFLRGLPTDGPDAGDPLAAAVPALCEYWPDPLPLECRELSTLSEARRSG